MHQKSGGWHVVIVLVFLIAGVAVGFLFHDVITAVMIFLVGVVLSYYGGHKPREITYQLDSHGLTIGTKHFQFSEFKAFSIVPEGAFETVQLIPTKRFLPMTTLFFDPQDGDKIIDILGSHLPHQERKADAIDSLMRKIKF
jgi:hypothetical protein